MGGFLRLLVLGFLCLTVVYVCLSIYSRAVRRSRLKRKWHDGPQRIDREAFVRRGLERYDRSVQRKLLLGVYVVPVVLIVTIVYLTNFS
jgi:Ca2+/Na+ antiporter